MKHLFLLLVFSIFMLNTTKSQTADYPANIGLHGGLVQYWGDLGNGYLKTNQAAYGFGGLSLSTYLSPYWDFNTSLNLGETGYYKSSTSSFRAQILQFDVNARLKFLGQKEKFTPYIFLGLGVTEFSKKFTVKDAGNECSLPAAGIGFNLKLTKNMYLQVQEKALYSINGEHDGVKNGDGYFFHTVGLTFNIGKMKDADGDGISDKLDKCPNTEPGVKVDLAGCPIDSDGDGIPDYKDDCINEKGTELNKGCPDRDGDGVIDSKDDCPDVAGLAQYNGCPDTDGDGIIDKLDKCPNEKGLKALDGCPDSDGDGIPDKDDKCSNTPAGVTVDATGCPVDTDGDGIPDYLDKCPTVKGTKANNGCPEVKEEVKKVFRQALQGVKFASGKNTILASSNPILNSVADILKQNPEYKLIINGHTDNSGNPAKNKALSQSRADAVKDYLIKKGIDTNRMKAFGYGDEKPIADNKTPAGRSQNRRVEFVVEF